MAHNIQEGVEMALAVYTRAATCHCYLLLCNYLENVVWYTEKHTPSESTVFLYFNIITFQEQIKWKRDTVSQNTFCVAGIFTITKN